MAHNSGRFHFDGGAATYIGTGILAFLVTVLTLGICTPYAVVLRQRWRAKHTYIDGHRLAFTGSAWGLFGQWLKWILLCWITIGIYLLWVVPRMTKWVVENTDFDPTWTAGPRAMAYGNTAAIPDPSPAPIAPPPSLPASLPPAPRPLEH